MSMSFEEFIEFMNVLDRSAIRRVDVDRVELVRAIKSIRNNRQNQLEFTDLRKSLWFRLVDERLSTFGANELLDLINCLIDDGINIDDYHGSFFHHAELLLVERMKSVTDPLAVLKIYDTLDKDMPEELLETWSSTTADNVGHYEPQQLIKMLKLLAKLKLRPNDRFIQAWCRRVLPLIDDRLSDPGLTADAVYACGKLHIDPISMTVEERLRSIRSNTESAFGRMNADQLVRSTYGALLLKIRLDNATEFSDYWLSMAVKGIDKFDQKSMGYAIWTAPKIERQQSLETFVSAWEHRFSLISDQFDATNLHTSLKGMHQCARRNVQLSSTTLRYWIDRADRLIADFWPQTLPNILNELRELSAKSASNFVEKCIKSIAPIADQLSAGDCAKLITSLAAFDVNPQRIDPKLMENWNIAVTANAKSKLWSVETKHEIREAMSKLGLPISRELEQQLEK